MNDMFQSSLVLLALTSGLLSTAAADRAQAQPAPIPRAVVPGDAAPEAMSELFTQLEPGENAISIEGAEWLQLKFADFQLGTAGTLTISTETGQSQTFTQDQLEDWEGLTAIFNGSEIAVTLTPGESAPGVRDEISATIDEIIIGLPGQDPEDAEAAAPQPLRNLLGDDMDRYIPRDLPRQPEQSTESAVQPEESEVEAICGSNDDRAASSNPLSGRIMPIGCTGWIIQGGALLTAGHCISASTQTVEFNVPASQSDGTTVSPRSATSTGLSRAPSWTPSPGSETTGPSFRCCRTARRGSRQWPRKAGHSSSRTRQIPATCGSRATAWTVRRQDLAIRPRGTPTTKPSRPIPAR